MDVVRRPSDIEPPTQPNTFVDTSFYIKLKKNFEFIFVLGRGEFMQQYQFNELDNRMSKLKTGQTVTKYAEETAMELDSEISIGAKLVGRYIIQQVAFAMPKHFFIMKRQLKTGERWKILSIGRVGQKR